MLDCAFNSSLSVVALAITRTKQSTACVFFCEFSIVIGSHTRSGVAAMDRFDRWLFDFYIVLSESAIWAKSESYLHEDEAS